MPTAKDGSWRKWGREYALRCTGQAGKASRQKHRSTDVWDAKEKRETCQWRTTSCWSMRFLQSSLPDPNASGRIYGHHQYFCSTQTSTREKAWQGTAWRKWLLRWGFGFIMSRLQIIRDLDTSCTISAVCSEYLRIKCHRWRRSEEKKISKKR